MTDAEVDSVIENTRKANRELHIRDNNGKVSPNNYNTPNKGDEQDIEKIDENSELELLSNLSSSTGKEQGTKERNLRRSKRLTKTNPIVRLNNPIPSDYRKYSQKTKRPGNNFGHRGHYGKQLDPTRLKICIVSFSF